MTDGKFQRASSRGRLGLNSFGQTNSQENLVALTKNLSLSLSLSLRFIKALQGPAHSALH